jgi:hypothetical protein
MSPETKELHGNSSTGSTAKAVHSPKIPLDANPYEDTDIHIHRCKNCSVPFFCSLPLCNGGWLDPELCPECEELLEGIW